LGTGRGREGGEAAATAAAGLASDLAAAGGPASSSGSTSSPLSFVFWPALASFAMVTVASVLRGSSPSASR